MLHLLQNFASEAGHSATEAATPVAQEAQKADLLGTLGIDPRLLILQTIAFLLVVFAFRKWVYPTLIKAIDDRQESIEAGVKASQEAQKAAEAAEESVAKELKAARKQADEILATTQKEAAALLAEAEEKASRRADNIVAEAKADMQNQLNAARESLKDETRHLVALATEQIIEEKIDARKDAQLVDSALKRARGAN